ncbi:MAG TPA: S8 family serine peptidase [Candidatus Thermoplasmatota archaeon]
MPARPRFAPCLALVFLLVPWAPWAVAAAPAGPAGGPPAAGVGPPPLLFMRAGTFDPAGPLPPFPEALLSPSAVAAPSGADSAGRAHFILQFAQPVDPHLLRALAARGVAYDRYLPDRGMVASAPLHRVPASAGEVGARALLPLTPAFKLDPALWVAALDPRGGTLLLAVLVFDAAGARSALEGLSDVLAFDGRTAWVEAPHSHLLAISRLGDVEWVEALGQRAPALGQTTRILGARQDTDGLFAGDGLSVWSYDAAADSFEGLTGRGVVVNVADTGVDLSHPAFYGRLVPSPGPAGLDPTNDSSGHGTHVAGIVAGNGSWRPADTNRTDGQYAGVAPEAGVVAQVAFTLLRTDAQRAQDALSAGAYINSNSWSDGCCGAYTGSAQTYDDLVRDANGRDAGSPPMVFVFASGNAGPSGNSGVSPGTAKNVITVGSVGNSGAGANTVSGFSSRGPTDDGRLKPDVVAPGAGVTSARAESSGCGGGYLGCSYVTFSGTSMSTPAVAGAAALVTQGYNETHGRLPSPAMVKASLIAGATPLPGYTWPDNAQGWGRVNVSRSVNEAPAFRHLHFDEDTALSLAGRTDITFRVFAGSDEELKVVLVWSDVPGTTSSSKALINDLDLEVRAPDGTLLPGNLFQGGFSVPGTGRDSGNNTEVVRVRAPQQGVWEVTVRAVAVPSGEQRFALVAQGNVTDRWVTVAPGRAEFLPGSPREDDPLSVIVPVRNTGTLYSGPMDITASIEGPEGAAAETVRLLGIMPGDDLPAVFHFAPARGTHTLRVQVDPGRESGDLLPGDNRRDGTVFVRGHEVAIEVLSAPSNVTPLGSTPFVLRVLNRGNVLDQVDVSATGPPGWGLGLNLSSSFLEAGGAALVSGAVVAPERALAGEAARFNFTATPAGNTSRQTSLELVVGVDPFVSLRLTPDAHSAWVEPGGGASFTFLAENAGNVVVSLGLVADLDAGAGAGWGVAAAPAALTIAPYANASGRIDVVAPAGALAGQVRTITLQPVSPEVPSASPLVFQVFVARVRAFDLDLNGSHEEIPAGSEAEFEGRIANRGNAREYFTVSLSPLGGSAGGVLWTVTPSSVAVDPGEQASFAVSAWALPGSHAGDSSARVRVVADGASPWESDVGVVVAARHAVTVSAPPKIVMPQGTAYSAGVRVTNDGNVNETLTFEATGGAAGVRLEGFDGTVTLAPGASHQLRARVVADAGSSAGPTAFQLVVRGGSSGAVAQAQMDVVVQPASEPPPPYVPGGSALAAVGAALAAAALGRRRARRLRRP